MAQQALESLYNEANRIGWACRRHLIPSNDAKAQTDRTCADFLQYKPPFETPTLELEFELDHPLSQVIATFKSMVCDDVSSRPKQLKGMACPGFPT